MWLGVGGAGLPFVAGQRQNAHTLLSVPRISHPPEKLDRVRSMYEVYVYGVQSTEYEV